MAVSNGPFADIHTAAYSQGRLKRKILLICPAYHETLTVPDKAPPADFDYQSIMAVLYPIERCFLHDLDDPLCAETNALLMARLLLWSNSPYYPVNTKTILFTKLCNPLSTYHCHCEPVGRGNPLP